MAQKRTIDAVSGPESEPDSPKRPKHTDLLMDNVTSGYNMIRDDHGHFGGGNIMENNLSQEDDLSTYSSYSKKMMDKMGYKHGEGLGKFGQGRSAIVEASKQRGRRGLGFEIQGLQAEDVDWVEEQKEVSIHETPSWLPSCNLTPPSAHDMSNWIAIGKKKTVIEDETNFCSSSILQAVLASKSVFDSLADDEFLKARTRANPYETIKGAIFQNRAAMKMANMDAVFDFMFSCPKTENNEELLGSMDLLYFADICAGPGGFSEYMLWRKGWHSKGFGFTLKGENDFKLDKFLSGTPETFEPFYGVNGIDGDGDIMNPDNLTAFQNFVLKHTDGKGVHLVLADGGFSVSGQENIQEILTKRLVLCQFLCALMILRKGGIFLCKTFDLFTPFSNGLVYLLYRAFDHVCVHKPVTSRPANSERYVICKGYRQQSEDVRDYLFNVNKKLERLKNTENDILEVVPLNLLKSDEDFCTYMKISNESLGANQVRGLRKLQAYVQNLNLVGKDQATVRKECLEYWKIPDIVRAAQRISGPDVLFQNLLKTAKDRDEMTHRPKSLNMETLQDLKILSKYKCYVSSGERFFLLGLGRTRIFKWDGSPTNRKRWQKLERSNFEMPKETLIEVEIVEELRGEGKGQRRSVVIHVIDALFLGGKDIRNRHYNHRMEYATMFVKAVNKPSRPDMTVLRAKNVFDLSTLSDIFDNLTIKRIKGSSRQVLCHMIEEDRAIVPTGVTFFKHLNNPWSSAFSKSQQKTYFFNSETKASQFHMPSQAIATFGMCSRNRYVWSWKELNEELSSEKPDFVTKHNILKFIDTNSR